MLRCGLAICHGRCAVDWSCFTPRRAQTQHTRSRVNHAGKLRPEAKHPHRGAGHAGTAGRGGAHGRSSACEADGAVSPTSPPEAEGAREHGGTGAWRSIIRAGCWCDVRRGAAAAAASASLRRVVRAGGVRFRGSCRSAASRRHSFGCAHRARPQVPS